MFKEPEYLERFKKLEQSKSKGVLEGNQLLIEKLEEEEDRKSKGGIILANSKHGRSMNDLHESTMAVILQTGEGSYDPNTGKAIPLDRALGNVIQVANPALTWETTTPLIQEGIPENKIARIDDRAVIRSWPCMQDYLKDLEVVNG